MGESFNEDKDLNRFRGLEINGAGMDEINEMQPQTFYKLIEEKFKKEDIKVTPDKLLDITGDDINVELNQIFVDYHIDMICCRRILLTSVNFYDLMNKTHLAGLPQY